MKLKEGKIKIDEFRRKLAFTEFDIMIRREYLFKSKIGKVFGNKKMFEWYDVKIYEIDPYIYKNN